MTSNCAGQPAGCTVNSATGFDVASFMLGFVTPRTRNLFDAGTYTEKRPEYALYVQDDFRATSKLTRQSRPAVGRLSAVDRGRRPPVELRRDDRQVRRRVRRRDDRGRQSRPLPADLFEARPRSALRLRLRPDRQRQDPGPRRLRHVLELLARRHVLVEGAEPAVPAVDVANADADRLRRQPAAQGRPAAASRSRPDAARRGRDAIDLRHQLPRRLRAAVEHQRPARLGTQLHGGGRRTSVRRAGRWS